MLPLFLVVIIVFAVVVLVVLVFVVIRQCVCFSVFVVPHLAKRAGGVMQGIVENSPLVAGWPRPEPAVAGQRWL